MLLSQAECEHIAGLLGPHGRGRSASIVWCNVRRWWQRQHSGEPPASLRSLQGAYRRWRERRRLTRRATTPAAHLRCLRPRGSRPAALGLPPAPPGIGCYNLGGPRIAWRRFRVVVETLARLNVGLWGLTEFRLTEAPDRYLGTAGHLGFALLWSCEPPRCGGGGVALLLHHALLAPGLRMHERFRGHLVSVPDVPLGGALGRTTVVLLYVPHQTAARRTLEPMLDALLAEHPHSIVLGAGCTATATPWLGDMNALTHPEDIQRPATVPAPVWRRPTWGWLSAREEDGSLVDVARRLTPDGPPQHTRVRLYSGTTSYLDRVYVTPSVWACIVGVGTVSVVDVSNVPGASDHDPVVWEHP